MTKRAIKFANTLSVEFEILQNLVSARFVAEGNSNTDSNQIANGYVQSLMIDMISNRFSQKEVLATIEIRKAMQREKIAELSLTA